MKKIMFLVVLLLFVVSTGYCSNESFVIKELDLELIKCPAGRFMMGSPEDELGRAEKLDEKLHSVIISKPFYIGQYEVTQSQYESVMGYNPSDFKGGNNPVETVSWFKAK
ncbi:MAG: SUMF1/EgtB/PvdO family nonheme iron enzyme, partial [Candidatus Riflebacteria bacterium]|nr:SUMF1/EgtB/PvdO family nonheme iron enzyme [Candidatus Riflebacteria bacterium]